MKILLLVLYYNRPKLLEGALESILKANQHHDDWEMIFWDDNSPIPGEPIVRKYLSEFLSRIKFINSNMSLEEKLSQGLMMGHYANLLIPPTNSDIAVTLCDDDELVPTYMADISNYFTQNPQSMWAYSHIVIFNPLCQNTRNIEPKAKSCQYNNCLEPIDPTGRLDASQIAWRIDAMRDGVQFPSTTKIDAKMPWLINHDREFFHAMYDRYGPAPFTGLTSQYKGIHDYQLIWHKKSGEHGLKEYMQTLHDLGGKKI